MDAFPQDHRFLANGLKPNGGHEGNCFACLTPDDATWNSTSMEKCEEFNTNCQCRDIGETCYSDFGIWYDILIISLFLAHAYIFYLSIPLAKECWTNYKTPGKNGKVKKLNPMDKCLLITCGCQFLRLLFLITIANGRHSSVLIGPSWVSAMLLKIYQVQLSGCFFFMTVVWKQLLDQASTMKKADPAAQAATERKVDLINIFLGFVLGPLYILGLVAIPILTTLVTLIQGLLIIFILVGALKFGLGLGKLIGSGGGNAAVAILIRAVVIRAAVFGCLILIAIVVNIMKILDFLGPWSQYIFWIFVHFCEAGLAHTLLYTKLQQKQNKIAAVKSSASSTSSVAPETETDDKPAEKK